MTGLALVPGGTLVDRALASLLAEPRSADWLAANVLGLSQAPELVADRLVVALLGADPRVYRAGDGRWALVAAARGAPRLEQCSFAVVDVETCGGRPSTDRITEIAVVLVQGPRRELVFQALVNPGRPISPGARTLTGITDANVRAAPPFEEIVQPVLDALAGRVFVAHNVRFDWAVLARELRRARDLRLEGPRLCTVRLARRLVPGAASCALDALAEWFGLENSARHRAAGDALVTAQILQRLLDLAGERGARTLPELVALQLRRRKRRRRSGAPKLPEV